MANITSIKIPELSELSQEELTGAEYLILDTGIATKKMQVSDFNRASTQTATAKANEAAQSATAAAQSALSAQNAAQAATDAIANATSQIAQSVIDVQTAKSDAESSANTARNLVNSDYALTARSYATGDAEDALGHEYREGQSTDNAKYYSEQCAAHDSAAAISKSNAKASENNAKASEIAAANSAESAAASARQALENSTGASVFSGSDAGLVPHSTKSNAFLRSDGKWDDTLATDDDLSALRTSLQTSFQGGVDAIYNACRDNFPSAEVPQQSTPTAIAASITSVMSSVFLENSRICTESPFSVTFYLPVLRLKAIVFEIDSDDIVYLNDKRVQPGVMYEDFSVGNTHMCKITIDPNPNVAYTGGLDIKYSTYYEMNAMNHPYTNSWTEDNPY